LGSCLDKTLMRERQADRAANWRAASSFPLVNYLPVAPVHEHECQLVNHGVLVQLDSVDTEPMDARDALTARSEGVRREHVNGVGVAQDRPLPRWTATMNASSMVSFATTCLGGSSG
jgi:hypothetical protein